MQLGHSLVISRFEVKDHRGAPTLFINGQAKFCQISWDYEGNCDISTMARTGCHIHLKVCPLGWTRKPGEYDYSKIDALIKDVLAKDPDGYVLLRVEMSFEENLSYDMNHPFPPAGGWWYEEHPEELVAFDDGRVIRKASYASEIWHKDAGDALAGLVRHVRGGPHGSHFLGVHLAFGKWGELACYGKPEGEDWQYADFSQPMVRRFRQWLRARYNEDAARLQDAWKEPHADFDTAQCPGRLEGLRSDFGTFRDPALGRQASDYFFFAGELTSEAAIGFARRAKEASDGGIICGVCGAGIFDVGASSYVHPHSFSVGTARLLVQSSHVDYIETPHSYFGRELGGRGLLVHDRDRVPAHPRHAKNERIGYAHPSRLRMAPPVGFSGHTARGD